jgi:hypothetical protein
MLWSDYVDDFLAMVARRHDGHDACRFKEAKRRILSLASELGVDLDKFAEGTRMIFLGVVVDTEMMRFEVPTERLSAIVHDLKSWPSRHGCTKHDLQCLVGSCNILHASFHGVGLLSTD